MGGAGAIAGAMPTRGVRISEPILKSGGSTSDSTLAFSSLVVVQLCVMKVIIQVIRIICQDAYNLFLIAALVFKRCAIRLLLVHDKTP